MTHPLFSPATGSSPPRVFVMAEIGVNHDGSVGRACELVEAAKAAGADAVKFQLFTPRLLLSNQARLALYQEGKSEDVFALLEKLQLTAQQLEPVRDAARTAGLWFVVTPFSLENVPEVRGLGVDAVKIASPDAVNTPLLRQAETLGVPMLVSTGTCELSELAPAAEFVRRSGGALLQCVSAYPTPSTDASLAGICVLAERFGVPVGYSDHTTVPFTGAMAVAAGACVIEKHLTYDVHANGPDHAASADPNALAQYIGMIRRTAGMLGPRRKTVLPVEADVRGVSRQSVCAARDLPAGHVLAAADLTLKRPGTGMPAARLDTLIGMPLKRPVKANDLLTEESV